MAACSDRMFYDTPFGVLAIPNDGEWETPRNWSPRVRAYVGRRMRWLGPSVPRLVAAMSSSPEPYCQIVEAMSAKQLRGLLTAWDRAQSAAA